MQLGSSNCNEFEPIEVYFMNTDEKMMEALKSRHSVRSYKNQMLSQNDKASLEQMVAQCNKESGLHVQLVCDEPKAFDCFMAHYGKFSGVTNYIALVGKKAPDLDEKCGYWGQKLVLEAQAMGLNTCWVAMSYKKIPGAFQVDTTEKLTVVIALGYGATTGVQHKSKTASEVSNIQPDSPAWFKSAVDAALLAPTAMNQQKFCLTLDGTAVKAKALTGPYSKLDLGIVKYCFEIGAGSQSFSWA
jgi:hypothetical protein